MASCLSTLRGVSLQGGSYNLQWGMGPIISVATQELGCLGAEEKDGTGENGLDTESICKPRPTSYPTVP